jgi:hypothetical protein
VKYSNIAGALTWSQGTILLSRGQSIEDDHPLVAERPDIWDDTAPAAIITTPHRVQTTMQGPGEHRMERGPSRPPVVKAPPRTQGQ